MTVRKATEGDIHKAGRLWLALVAELAPSYSPNVLWWRRLAAASMRAGSYFMLVAEEGQKQVGFIDCFIFPEPSDGYVHAVGQHLYVLPEYRASGLAGRLYRAASVLARKSGAVVFELFCFPGQQAMWEKKGYAPARTMVRKSMQGGKTCSIR